VLCGESLFDPFNHRGTEGAEGAHSLLQIE
jgi:hypothetical protein